MSTPITLQQQEILDSLICERLTSHDENQNAIKSIVNNRNPNLVKALQSDKAWKEDTSNSTLYYLVKTQSGTILAFFALRCGEVFRNVDEDLVKIAHRFIDNLSVFLDSNTTPEEKNRVKPELAIAIRNGWNPEIAGYYIRKSARRDEDVKNDVNKDNHRVADTFSSVEVTVFCKNEAAGVEEEWRKLGLPYSIGLSVFWHHIVPKIKKLISIVGCDYLYLFAADKDADGELVNYYKTKLHFINPVKLGANKPSFDYDCFFLCQRVSEVLKHYSKFYSAYNHDITDAV